MAKAEAEDNERRAAEEKERRKQREQAEKRRQQEMEVGVAIIGWMGMAIHIM